MLVGVFHFDSQLRSAYPGVGATLSPWVLRLEQGLCFPYAVAGLGRGNRGSACHCREPATGLLCWQSSSKFTKFSWRETVQE